MKHNIQLALVAIALQGTLTACTAAPETPAKADAPIAKAAAPTVATSPVSTTTAGWPAKPGPDNTGPTDRSLLQPMDGTTIDKEGTVLENVAIKGMMRIKADNVTIRNFTIDAGTHYGIQIAPGVKGTKIENGEIINVNSAAILGMGFHAIALNIHESGGDGIKPQGTGGPVIIERCWIHHLGKNEGAHADAIQSVGGEDMTFRHNFFDLEVDPKPPYKANANFMLQNKKGKLANLTIEQNWIDGGGWMIYVPGNSDNIRIVNNKFSREYRFGLINGLEHTTWQGNVWEDTGEPIEMVGGKAVDPTHVKMAPSNKKKD